MAINRGDQIKMADGTREDYEALKEGGLIDEAALYFTEENKMYLGERLISGTLSDFDDTPTEDSPNAVKSGGIKTYVDDSVNTSKESIIGESGDSWSGDNYTLYGVIDYIDTNIADAYTNNDVTLEEVNNIIKDVSDYVDYIEEYKTYLDVEDGCYIVGSDGNHDYCFTSSEWAGTDERISLLGLGIISGDQKFILSIEDCPSTAIDGIQWDSNYATNGSLTYCDNSTSLNTGIYNTNIISDINTDVDSCAAAAAKNFEWFDTSKISYLGSYLEWQLIIDNKVIIKELLSACGYSEDYFEKSYWTSTQYDNDDAWVARFINGNLESFIKSSNFSTKPFTRFNDVYSYKLVLKDRIDSLIDGIDTSVYDKIIRTQDEFEELISSSVWLGAKSVAFVGSINDDGTDFKFSKTDGTGIHIPDTVDQIDGYNNAIISVTGVTDTSVYALYRDELNKLFTANGSLTNITLYTDAQQAIGNLNLVSKVNLYVPWGGTALRMCSSLDRCEIRFTEDMGTLDRLSSYGILGGWFIHSCRVLADTSLTYTIRGFYQCSNINQCACEITSGGIVYGFQECSNVTGCDSGVVTKGSKAVSFVDCTAVTGGISYATTTSATETSSKYAYGAIGCDTVTGLFDRGSTHGATKDCTNVSVTEEYVDDAVSDVEVDLTGYATESYVDKQIAESGGSSSSGGLDTEDLNNLSPIEIGNNNTTSGEDSSAFGSNNTANYTNSTAIGYGAITTSINQIALGGSGQSVKVGNLSGTDTRNVSVNEYGVLVATPVYATEDTVGGIRIKEVDGDLYIYTTES